MTQFKYVFFSVLLTIFMSCQNSEIKIGNYKLLPEPQHFEMSGTSNLKGNDLQFYFSENVNLPVLGDLLESIQKADNKNDSQIYFSIDENIDSPSEGYLLNIEKSIINIIGKDKAGLFYGFKTLEQLVQDALEQGANLPICSIIDFPSLAYRSIHLDVKHHLEKTDYYYRLMDKLSSYKVNAIIVEMEDKLKYERVPEIGAKDALSIDEWKKLSDYGHARNIKISPLIQGLGHSSFILKHEKFKALRDDPKSDWAFNPLDPKTYEVQFDLYLDAIDATPHGKYLHIGGDEVHTTGRGSGKSPLELQLMWLDKVCKFAAEHNRIPIFWDDMPLKHAGVYKAMFDNDLSQEDVDRIWVENEPKLLEFLDQFPKNCIYMRWNYSNSDALGNARAMDWFRSHGLKVMGATAGQTRWVLMPQKESNMNNIRSFAVSSIENDLNGLLLTLWDDDSPHFELYMRGIIAFAQYSWSGDNITKPALKSAYRQREFSNEVSDDQYAFIDDLEGPVGYWKNALLEGNMRNYLQKNDDPINEAVIAMPNKGKMGEWSEKYKDRITQSISVLKQCDSIAQKIEIMKSKANRNNYTLEVYEQVNDLVRFTPKAILALKAYDDAESEQQILDAKNNLKGLSEEFNSIRSQFETVYGKTRILTKADDYILDQDHHHHLANQTNSFDWQFYAEMLFLEKVNDEL